MIKASFLIKVTTSAVVRISFSFSNPFTELLTESQILLSSLMNEKKPKKKQKRTIKSRRKIAFNIAFRLIVYGDVILPKLG